MGLERLFLRLLVNDRERRMEPTINSSWLADSHTRILARIEEQLILQVRSDSTPFNALGAAVWFRLRLTQP